MKITSFGEVLWDIFPEQKKIGGAPLNVALRLNAMGVQSSILTRIGNDDLGSDIKDYAKQRGILVDAVQIDNHYKTGEVLVTLDNENTATYKISKPVAWDFIEYSDTMKKIVKESDAFVFGSLASRNEVSRKTLFQLLENAKFKILDVNLRPPHYTTDLLLELMQKADFIKLNDEELEEICAEFKILTDTIENKILEVSKRTNTSQICITKGSQGAILFFQNHFYYNKGYKVKVIDTVGAGDSFLATLVCGLLNEELPQLSIDIACAVGAMVAAKKGANPIFSKKEIIEFIEKQ